MARDLLGMRLVRRRAGRTLAGRILEVEAYIGTADTACHASRGLTARNAVMFGRPGHAYVYFTYGMHWMLNVVTEPEGTPAAVLIRALEPLEGIESMRRRRENRVDRDLARGPARLCQALAIDGSLNGADLVGGDALFLERGAPIDDREVAVTPRVGIDYAAEIDLEAPWRFLLVGSPFVSTARARVRRDRRPRASRFR